MEVPRLVIGGTHSGVGKTSVTLALLSALRKRGRTVQAFKVGPDFIDPGHHAVITGRPSRNLDGWMLSATANQKTFCGAASGADISIIEGVMGLFDGSSATTEIGSTAQMAKQLGAPVLLVLDGSAMARSAAAMVLGYATFDRDVRFAGVIFNRVSGEGHYRLLKEAVEAHTNVGVLGYLPRDPAFTIADRHLGLVTAIEQGTEGVVDRLGVAAAQTIDLARIEALAAAATPLTWDRGVSSPKPLRHIRVGIAYDAAFCFYYSENLELLEQQGAELIRFSPMSDQTIPDVEMLYLGGGYPELHAEALAKNEPMRWAIKEFADQGGRIYAECGGMMYLTQAIRDFEGRSHHMVGIFEAEAVMRRPGLVLGYREIETTRPCLLGKAGTTARGHEFHYSQLVPKSDLNYAWTLKNAQGRTVGQDGLTRGNVLGAYTHLHFGSQPEVAIALLESRP